jgi:hypothetical protein
MIRCVHLYSVHQPASGQNTVEVDVRLNIIQTIPLLATCRFVMVWIHVVLLTTVARYVQASNMHYKQQDTHPFSNLTLQNNIFNVNMTTFHTDPATK